MSIFGRNRCKLCRVRRQQRFCFRKGRDICWECCNELRHDRQCPEDCRYSLQKNEHYLVLKTSVDSETEFRNLFRKVFLKWIKLPEKHLHDKIPEDMALVEEEKNELLNYLQSISFFEHYDAQEMLLKLGIDSLKIPARKKSFEEIADMYLKLLLVKDYEKSIAFRFYKDKLEERKDWKEDYIKQMNNDKILGKMNQFELISSALSDDKKQALVMYDISKKYDLSLKLFKHEDEWLVRERIMGKMELVNGENKAAEQVALLLSQSKAGAAEELLSKYLQIYPEAADFYYYQSVYNLMQKNNEKAIANLERSVRLDPAFKESIYMLALLLQQNDQLDLSLKNYRLVEEIDDCDIKTKNNIAAIMIDQLKLDEAEKYLQDCLKIDQNFEPAVKNLERIKEIRDT